MMAGFEMPVPVIRQYIASAVGLVIQISRLKGGARKIVRITELLGRKDDHYIARDLFGFRQTGVQNGVAVGEFYATGKKPNFLTRLRAAGLHVPDSIFAQNVLATAEHEAEEVTPIDVSPDELSEGEMTTDQIEPIEIQDDDPDTRTTYID